jgi:hypothetical protein
MRLCSQKANSLWWNSAEGGCPQESDRKWCFLRLSELYRAYETHFYDDCLFSNRFSVGSHPSAAICHALKIWNI